ncbi:glycoside hydrolase family 88 protein [Alkalibacterium iburiense]|uniref:Glycoside hydrolase family 88 protein n=1 Tax=Alkalibacterium iburiense TaxID=290589 RepID=A0ABN0XPR0_9LACT
MTEQKLDKNLITEKIDLLAKNLSNIKDETGEYLLNFNGLIVDDKSWHVWNWPQGVGLYGLFAYYKFTQNKDAKSILDEWFNQRILEGSPPKNVNTMAPLLAMAFLYEEGNNNYRPYLEQWADWVMYDMPRTEENGLQHMTYSSVHDGQLWADTLMMSVLPLAKIGLLLNKPEYVEDAKKQFLIHTKYLADKKTGLWFHGWNFNGHHNYANALWGRGNCWATISIPEIIDILNLKPGDHMYDFLVSTLNRQIKTLKELQDDSGMWHTLLDHPDSYLESSATAGFAFGILKGIRKRYVSKEFLPVAEKAIRAIINNINDDGAVENVSVGTGLAEDLNYYKSIKVTTMPYGQSLAILALTEYLYTFA